MWYLLQILITGYIGYFYMTEVAKDHAIGHALFIGGVVAWFVTLTLTSLIDGVRNIIRRRRVKLGERKLLRRRKELSFRRRHQQARNHRSITSRSLTRLP